MIPAKLFAEWVAGESRPKSADVEDLSPPQAPTVLLLVERGSPNGALVRKTLEKGSYRVLEAECSEEAREQLSQGVVDLLVVAAKLRDGSVGDFCRGVKSDRRTRLLPVLMLGTAKGVESELAALAAGADEYLGNPLHPDLLDARIAAMIRNKMAVDSLDEAEMILFSVAQAVEKRDKSTGDHCRRLARYSVALGRMLGLPNDELIILYRGGHLHDIGKIAVPDAILFKEKQLTAAEWDVMKRHTEVGEDICRPMKSLAPVLCIIRSHHEKADGTGYPDGLRGEQIPLHARIVQTADIYDALTHRRPYKPALDSETALGILEDEARRGWRDAELVRAFRSVIETEAHSRTATAPLVTMSRRLIALGD